MSKNFIPYERVWKTREMLVSSFPGAFKGFKEPKPPLKVGIFKDIRRELPEISARALTAALADYTGGPSYLSEVKAGAMRVDLHGEPTTAVTDGQASYASERRRVVIHGRKERRKALRVAAGAAEGQTAVMQIPQHQAEEGALSA